MTAHPGKSRKIGPLFAGLTLGAVLGACMALFLVKAALPSGHRPADPGLCARRLGQVAKALRARMADGTGQAPLDLAALVQADLLPADALVCPGARSLPARTARREDLESHCDYVYVAGLDAETPARTVWAFELPANHGQHHAGVVDFGGGARLARFPPGGPPAGRSLFLARIQRANDHLADRRRRRP